MEAHKGNSAPVVKEFQIEGTWAPVTPIKPTLIQPRPIYEDGEIYLKELEDHLSRVSQQHQVHTLLSGSIGSAEIRSNPTSNNSLWENHNNNNNHPSIFGSENVGLRRQGLENCLPHWSSQGRRSVPPFGSSAHSSFPSFSGSWEMPPSNNGPRENTGVLDNCYDDSMAHFNNMSFGDLLAMKGSTFEPSTFLTRLGDSNSAGTSALIATCDSESDARGWDRSFTFGHQDTLCGVNLQINGIRGGQMHCGAFHSLDGSLSNVNTPSRTMPANGQISTVAPPTPDLRWRAQSIVGSGTINTWVDQPPNEQTVLQEHEAAAAMVNLQEVNNKEITGNATDSSPVQVSVAVEENHNPDKVGEQGIDLNKTPQKKPRRKRYLPKVVSENKPKRTPKPNTPKPMDSKETPRVKRKYVRKNKMNPPLTPPLTGAAETSHPKPTGQAVKSCRKSLNFDLNEQETAHNLLHMSDGGLNTKPPATDNHATGNLSSHAVHLGQGEEPMVEKSDVGVACDLNHTLGEEMKNYTSQPVDKLESMSRPSSSPCASSNEEVQTRGSKRGHSSVTDAIDGNSENVAANHCTFWQSSTTLLGNANFYGVPGILFPEICKKKRTDKAQRCHTPSTPPAASEVVSPSSNAINHSRVDTGASKYYCCNPPAFGGNVTAINRAAILMRNAQSRMQILNTWADIARLKKKKRSKGTTRVRDLSELKGIASVSPATPAAKCPRRRNIEISNKSYCTSGSYTNLLNSVQSCIEALTDDMQTTPRSKRGPRKLSSSRGSDIVKANKHWDLVLYGGNHSVGKEKGTWSSGKMYCENNEPCPATFSRSSVRWISSFSLDAITEGLKLLDINKEGIETPCPEQSALVPYRINNEEQNALVLYKKEGGAIVPFEGPFEPIRKRRQRAKVDLDDETTRVWRLLLENIDNQGIDGTDEEKVKWWENERSVFGGRVDSFIARMRLVQGDRRFTPWKGSVLDSVIGVFLTQNVSDHLSSSAFMALAARFPLKSEHNESTLSEEAMSALVVEPEVFIIEPEESIRWNEKALESPCDGNCRIIHVIDHGSQKEVVNSKELIGSASGSVIPTDYSCEISQKATNESRIDKANSPATDTEGASIIRDDRARDDATSSVQSVISSQNSINSPSFQAVQTMSSFSETNPTAQATAYSSKCNYFDCSTSFMGLLKMAESPLLHESHREIPGQDQPECMTHIGKDHSDAPSTSSNCQSNLQLDFHLQASKYIEMLEAESRSSDASRKDENSPTEQSNLTELTVQNLGREKALDGGPRSFAENMSSCYVLEGEKMVIHSQTQSMERALEKVASSAQGRTSSVWKSSNLQNLSQEPDVTESTTGFDGTSNYQKEINQISKATPATPGNLGTTNPSPSKPKSRSGKEKRNAFDWDSLRKHAQANGRIRERTANTRDSIAWEAVRLADVSEIADTIKARGMNNMLAERIKELLDRLVRDHGSIDLEWLRDIPPDKAKEYLLSFRGLGLKSVECVRLLTLHHLAFPVDTNVGRIAVRLGWVPLQPLPESLQLHLLELYPVLESIQKYLWPRLCKLDQKTLYELHYHMITFGKVFCTKRQPNCNACPLRGECRHFASAFASARLALPGPEERSIMPSSRGTPTHPHPHAHISPLPLPSLWGNHHQEANSRCNTYASIIEVPSTPLSLSLPQAVNQFEKKSELNNCDPIVEVPASPEPEMEQDQTLCDIEDTLYEDPDEIPTIKLNMKEFTQTLENFMQANRELQETGMSKALVALKPEAASIPTPKLKNISRLRTEHHVYELPDTHPLLKELDRREPDDPCSYLLAIWTPGETANSIEPPERRCCFDDPSTLCNEVTCSYCGSQREANSQIVRGTLLIPCRTAMRGSFPLNGTYFQVNEVFADHDSSLSPIEVPRSWLWNLPRRTVYFGTSIPTIFRGLTTEEIQHCFWRGYVCVRGFDQKTRAPRPLMARLHFPASKMPRGPKGKGYADDE